MEQTLHWDAIYEIVLALMKQHPGVEMEEVSLRNIYDWVLALPNFEDDPELANDEILSAIYQEWFEELNPL